MIKFILILCATISLTRNSFCADLEEYTRVSMSANISEEAVANWLNRKVLIPCDLGRGEVFVEGVKVLSGLSRAAVYYKLGRGLGERLVPYANDAGREVFSIFFGVGSAVAPFALGYVGTDSILEKQITFARANICCCRCNGDQEIEESRPCRSVVGEVGVKLLAAGIATISASTFTYLTFEVLGENMGSFWLLPGVFNCYAKTALDYFGMQAFYTRTLALWKKYCTSATKEDGEAQRLFPQNEQMRKGLLVLLQDSKRYLSTLKRERAVALTEEYGRSVNPLEKIRLLLAHQVPDPDAPTPDNINIMRLAVRAADLIGHAAFDRKIDASDLVGESVAAKVQNATVADLATAWQAVVDASESRVSPNNKDNIMRLAVSAENLVGTIAFDNHIKSIRGLEGEDVADKVQHATAADLTAAWMAHLEAQKKNTTRDVMAFLGGAIGVAGIWIYYSLTVDAFQKAFSLLGASTDMKRDRGLAATAITSASSLFFYTAADSTERLYTLGTSVFKWGCTGSNGGPNVCSFSPNNVIIGLALAFAIWNASQQVEYAIEFTNLRNLGSELTLAASLFSMFSVLFWSGERVAQKFYKYWKTDARHSASLVKAVDGMISRVPDMSEEALKVLYRIGKEDYASVQAI